ncbi:MAG TPA: outer membrane lipoprotein-sorting protein [Thermoanaerobaculia bacterium]|jgi:outer membrane lipoprotein-sorting protein
MKNIKQIAIALTLTAASSLIAAGTSTTPSTGVTPAADQLLSSVDRTRNGWSSFTVDVKINNFKKDKAVDTNEYQIFIKGTDRTLVKFQSPQDKGKSLLMLEEGMWLYLPSASRPIRVTPLQRLSGNANNGDIAQTNLAANYSAKVAGEETVGGKASWVLDLTARRKNATYQAVRLWIDKKEMTPVQAEFRLTSGKPVKRVEYVEYDTYGSQRMVRKQVMYDLLRNEQKTIVEYRNYTQKDLADKLFNRNSMR